MTASEEDRSDPEGRGAHGPARPDVRSSGEGEHERTRPGRSRRELRRPGRIGRSCCARTLARAPLGRRATRARARAHSRCEPRCGTRGRSAGRAGAVVGEGAAPVARRRRRHNPVVFGVMRTPARGAGRRRRGRARLPRAGGGSLTKFRAARAKRGARTSVRMSAMPQARPSLLGPRSTRKVQPVQSSRASFLWLFSSVAMVLCAALAP